MRKLFLCLVAATAFLVSNRHLVAAETNSVATGTNAIPADTNSVAAGTNSTPATNSAAPANPAAAADLGALVDQVNADLKAGKRTEAEQADHLQQFDALLAKYKGDPSEDVAKILYMKAVLYLDVFGNYDKGAELIKQIKHDFPATIFAKHADEILAAIAKKQAAAKNPVAATTNSAAAADLNALIGHINDDLQAGKRSEADEADHLHQFDVLLAKYKGDTGEDVARILFMKAKLYLEVFGNIDKGIQLLKQLKQEFPDTNFGRSVDENLAGLEREQAAAKIQTSLVENTTFPDFNVSDLDGKPLSLSSYRGKVVMVEFWATWCPPCRLEVPYVAKAYEKYHDKGFDVIGISLDHAEDKDKLTAFLKENNMPWRQYFDGKYWANDLAVKYGVMQVPTGYLLDRDGKILAKSEDLMFEKLDPAIVKALGVN